MSREYDAGGHNMLHDEYKKKIKKAVKTITSIIRLLEGGPIDPRAVSLLDIAASYLEEQHENEIEYHEEEVADDITGAIAAQTVYFEDAHDDEPDFEFKFLEPHDIVENHNKISNMFKPKDGNAIADEIQKWYEEGMPEK